MVSDDAEDFIRLERKPLKIDSWYTALHRNDQKAIIYKLKSASEIMFMW